MNAASSRSSTTARMVTPARVRVNRKRRKAATIRATITTVTSWYETRTSAIFTECPAKNCGMARALVGDQITWAVVSRITSSASVITRETPVDRPWSLRMSTRSMTAPSNGDRMNSTTTSASGVGQP